MNDMKLSMIIQLVDKVTKPLKNISASNNKFAESIHKSDQFAKKLEKNRLAQFYNRLSNSTGNLSDIQYKLGDAFDWVMSKASRMGAKVHKLKGYLSGTASGAREFLEKSGKAFALATAVTAGGIFGFQHSFIDTAATFEQYQTVLKTVEGSNAKAKKSMDWIQNFAVTTPYELDNVTEAFVRLKSYGLDPTDGLLRTLGDTSSAMAKPLMQSVEAIADAVTGENERLKEFGINANTKGNLITYSYTDKNGQTKFKQALYRDRQQIIKVLSDIFNEKFKGSMEAQSKTWNGMMSNMMDMWTKFQVMVMHSGVFDWLKGKLSGALDKLNEMAANGQLQEMAKNFSGSLIKTFESLWKWAGKLSSGFDQFMAIANQVSQALGGWENTIIAVMALPLVPAVAAMVSAIVGMIAVIGWPITALIAIAAVVYAKWDKIKDFFEHIWDKVQPYWQGFTNFMSGLWTGIKEDWQSFLNWIDSFVSKITHPFKTLLEYGSKLKDILGFGGDSTVTQKVQQVADHAKRATSAVVVGSALSAPAIAAQQAGAAQGYTIKIDAPITIQGNVNDSEELSRQIDAHIEAAVRRALNSSLKENLRGKYDG